jgi:hypothetical protein
MAVFYEQLFAGRTVSQAVAAGRHALREQSLRPSLKGDMPLQDWLVPVHYTRATIALPDLARQRQAARAAPEAFFAGLIEEAKRRQAEPQADARAPTGEDPLGPEGGAFFGRDNAFYALERAVRFFAALEHWIGAYNAGYLQSALGYRSPKTSKPNTSATPPLYRPLAKRGAVHGHRSGHEERPRGSRARAPPRITQESEADIRPAI